MSGTAFVEGQKSLLEARLAPFARPGDRYALVDFPNYANVGDSAIWLGAGAVLRRLTGRAPVHVGGQGRFGLVGLARRLAGGTIYITGGGNFGDLWPAHQAFRELLLARFPDNRIVQLPQSIHFESDAAVRRSAGAISRHGGFHLMVRDAPGEAFAAQHFDCPVVRAPDCAFGLGALEPSGDPSCSLFGLLRTDKERSPADRSPLAALGPRVGDWVREPGPHHPRQGPAGRWSGFLTRRLSGFGSATAFDRAAQRRLHRGIRMLSSGSQVVTDRLHGHILSVLLGIPHVALDNSTGKVAAYYRGWTHGAGTGLFVADPGDAAAALLRLPRRAWAGAAGNALRRAGFRPGHDGLGIRVALEQ